MLINELAKAVHENAVAHGWWDDEREAPEINALIHSEWSEALEEARADMPLAYIRYKHTEFSPVMDEIIPRGDDGTYISEMGLSEGQCITDGKPEGVAVELIDGCIRILDLFGKLNVNTLDDDTNKSYEIEGLYEDEVAHEVKYSLPHTVAILHKFTANALTPGSTNGDFNPALLLLTMTIALSWVRNQGLDPLAILLEKHEYNKTRPYKHGKKF